MSAVRGIISLVMVGIFLWFTITSYQRYLDAQEDVKIAQKEYDIAAAENAQAQKEFQNVLKYNCANPVITSGVVSCPNG
jgi:cell division protein FtsB